MARILVADDDVDIRELVEFKLSTLGHEVVAVADGASAVEEVRRRRPDLAVLDVMMPGMSGLDAVRVIRGDESLHDLPVILLTARAQESDREHGFDSGADDYVTKPFSPRELAARVEALLASDPRGQRSTDAAGSGEQTQPDPCLESTSGQWQNHPLVPVHVSASGGTTRRPRED